MGPLTSTHLPDGDRQFRRARRWSNAQLRQIAPLCGGRVVNVSAGDDDDKEGSTYDRYFAAATTYTLTNIHAAFRGFQGRPNEIPLDLTDPLPPGLAGSFDVVFNHTTLEHVFDVRTAFRTLCELSADLVIVVVPFAQVQHENVGYQDFWRFTPTCLRGVFGADFKDKPPLDPAVSMAEIVERSVTTILAADVPRTARRGPRWLRGVRRLLRGPSENPVGVLSPSAIETIGGGEMLR